MSDPYQTLVLEELGLLPLWVRHDLVEAPPPPLPTTAPTTAPVAAATGPAPYGLTPPPLAVRDAMVSGPLADRPAAPASVSNEVEAEAVRRAGAIADMDWQQLQASVAACTACGLCKSRSNTVFGVGNPAADWLVVGEAPGADEDRQGEPFVGQAGKLLDAMLESVERSRQQNVYILNTLKCRPPQNRNPNPEELALCAPYLHRQIALIQPKVIFAVGRFAVQALLGKEASIASLRGQRHDYRGIPVVVSYHPAYLLRNMPDKIKAWQDLLLTRRILAGGPADHTG
jgi:DNA polymerase